MLNSNEDLIHIVKQNALKVNNDSIDRRSHTQASLTVMETQSKKLIGVIPIDND